MSAVWSYSRDSSWYVKIPQAENKGSVDGREENKVRAEKDTQTQRFHQKIPCLNPPSLGGSNPRNSLCSDCVFLWNVGKTQTQRILKGGEGGQKKIFVLDFFGCFFALYKEGEGRWRVTIIFIIVRHHRHPIVQKGISPELCATWLSRGKKGAISEHFLLIFLCLGQKRAGKNPRSTQVRA